MLINMWYVVGPSSLLKDKLIPVRIAGQDFVAFRDEEGKAHLLSDICIHRGASLSAGVKINNSVRCPYHGWEFNGDGICTKIPAHPDGVIPSKARVDSYPIREHRGWVWAFLGDKPESERPSIPPLNWVESPDVRVVRGYFDWDVSWDRVIENGLDFSHAPFVHSSTFGNINSPEIFDFQVESDEWSGQASIAMRKPIRSMLLSKSYERHKEVFTRLGFNLSGPCTILELHPRNNWRVYIASAHVPIDKNRTRTWWVMGRNFLRSSLFDKLSIKRNLRIFLQDHEVLKNVRPERVPNTWQDEVSVRSDALQIAFRKRLMDLKKFRIDDVRLHNYYVGKKACAIPSPNRGDKKTWVIDSIPLEQS